MANLLVSMATKDRYVGILVARDGKLVCTHTEKLKDDIASVHEASIAAFNTALRITRQVVQSSQGDKEVTFEVSNSTFLKWVESGNPKLEYYDRFMDTMRILQSIPMRYTFSYNPKPKALMYANKSSYKPEKVSGLL